MVAAALWTARDARPVRLAASLCQCLRQRPDFDVYSGGASYGLREQVRSHRRWLWRYLRLWRLRSSRDVWRRRRR